MDIIGLLGAQKRVQFLSQATGAVLLTLEASVSETHSRESTPTHFEVEDGNTVSDHIILKPFKLKLTGLITDTPINTLAGLVTSVASIALPPVGLIAAGAAFGLGQVLSAATSNSDAPSVAAYKSLIQIQANRQPINVLTTLSLYKNMWIESISVPREAGTGKSLIFEISLVQLLLVTPQTINISKLAAAGIGAAQVNAGKQEPVNREAIDAFNKGFKNGYDTTGIGRN